MTKVLFARQLCGGCVPSCHPFSSSKFPTKPWLCLGAEENVPEQMIPFLGF
jgi:hypothetical protein